MTETAPKRTMRLQTIAAQARPCACLIDVGCDHGYIPITLVQNGIVKRAIASDLSKASLEKAQANIARRGLADRIETRLGSGLSVARDETIDLIIMAGMGGHLILDMLKAAPGIVSAASRLILQPQLDVMAVRVYIHAIGYTIVNEEMVYEDRQFYTVLVCEKGREKRLFTQTEYRLGRLSIDRRCPVLKAFLERERRRIRTIIQQAGPAASERVQALRETDACYKEVLNLYETK